MSKPQDSGVFGKKFSEFIQYIIERARKRRKTREIRNKKWDVFYKKFAPQKAEQKKTFSKKWNEIQKKNKKTKKIAKKSRHIVKNSSICPQGLARCGKEVYYGYRVWGSIMLPIGVR